ncbi:MAG: hypothetical protein ACOX7K_01915 [Oscillospiraceae bacterium]|jgi:hypothetical protein
MKEFLLDTMFRTNKISQKPLEHQKRIILLREEEFQSEVNDIPHKKTLLLGMTRMKYCKAELYGSCIFGTLVIPVKKNPIEGKIQFGFYIWESQLYLIGDEEQLTHLVGRMQENQFSESLTVISAIFLPLVLLVGWHGMNFCIYAGTAVEDGMSGCVSAYHYHRRDRNHNF